MRKVYKIIIGIAIWGTVTLIGAKGNLANMLSVLSGDQNYELKKYTELNPATNIIVNIKD